MSNIVYTWKDEKHIFEETELTDTQLVDVSGALGGVGDLGLDTLGDSLNLSGDQPSVSGNYESSRSYVVPNNRLHQYKHKKVLLFLETVKNIG